MKKYNLSAIMKRAWELVKKAGMSISSSLKKAWKEVKGMCKELPELVGSPKRNRKYFIHHYRSKLVY